MGPAPRRGAPHMASESRNTADGYPDLVAANSSPAHSTFSKHLTTSASKAAVAVCLAAVVARTASRQTPSVGPTPALVFAQANWPWAVVLHRLIMPRLTRCQALTSDGNSWIGRTPLPCLASSGT